MENEVKNTEQTATISNSKQKRLERQKKRDAAKKSEIISKVIAGVAIVAILAAMGYAIAMSAIKSSKTITASNDYSAGLNNDGYISGVTASSLVSMPDDYANITVPASEVEYTDAMWEEEIETQLNNHLVINTESTAEIKDGDKIGLDYVGSVDGEEFEGGTTNGAGTDLTIGSGQFIDGFESQLIGHKVGDNFDINVTFPADYQSEDLAGKDAVFNITINGIYEKGEFNDAFVAENLAAYADTVDGYREYLTANEKETKKKAYVEQYLDDNTTVSKYPSKYLKILKSLQKYGDHQSYDYMNQIYMNYYGQGYSTFEEYTGMTEEEYDLSLDEKCKDTEKATLICQAICEKQGFTMTDDELKAKIVESTGSEDGYQTQLDTYGIGYLKQMYLNQQALDFCVDNAVIK